MRKCITFPTLDDFASDLLRDWSREIEERLQIPGLSTALHFILMELSANAARANLKRIYFEQRGFSPENPAGYAQGIAAFMSEFSTLNQDEYRPALRAQNLEVQVVLDLTPERLLLQVENSTKLLEEEERRIRNKLARSLETRHAVDFSLEHGDETEGHGLGLAMIVLFLKDLGYDPANFRIYGADERTVARLEIPLTHDYVPLRERYRRWRAREHESP